MSEFGAEMCVYAHVFSEMGRIRPVGRQERTTGANAKGAFRGGGEAVSGLKTKSPILRDEGAFDEEGGFSA